MDASIFKNWWLLLINGIILTLLGIVSIFVPFTAVLTVALYIGIAALFSGIFLIAFSLSNTNQEGWGWRFVEGIIDLIFGFVLLANPYVSAALVPMLIGIWIFIRGIMFIVDAFSWRKVEKSGWGWYVLLGAVLTLIGIYMTIDWQFGLIPVAFLIAIILLIIGIASIVISIDAKRIKDRLEK